jgi:flagellar biogenesis protein FliO
VDVTRQVLSIFFVFALLGLALWTLRRKGAAIPRTWGRKIRGPRRIESLERLPLTPQHVLHLVRVGGREMIVATHPQGCSVLSEAGDAIKGAGA